MTKEALKLALEALESCDAAHITDGGRQWYDEKLVDKAITAIKEALANEALDKMAENARELGLDYEPEQKPVAWMNDSTPSGIFARHIDGARNFGCTIPLYTTPPQRTWVGLTPQERDEINEQVYGAVPHHVAFHAAIEAKLKEKNNG
jgi:hypothetical protein